ncbi:MAG TPA: histidine phosphatase family protein [Chloroflexota bacterium]|nr:histidine phosphatase family protein [Chloroflexota bacterium]
MSTRLLFVRHAEVHNPRNVVYGRLPRFRLSARGREQAQLIAECLADEPVAAIYTSPLLRARQTALAIAAFHPGVPVRRNALLAEIRTGWQGTPNKEVPKGTSFYVDRKHPDDEVVEDVLARQQRLVRLLLRRHRDQAVVCVGHADPIAVLTLWAGGETVTPKLLQEPLAPARGAVVIFEYPTPDALPILSYWNPQPPEPEKHSADGEAAYDGTSAPAADAAPADGNAAPADAAAAAAASAPATTGAVSADPTRANGHAAAPLTGGANAPAGPAATPTG